MRVRAEAIFFSQAESGAAQHRIHRQGATNVIETKELAVPKPKGSCQRSGGKFRES